MSFEYDRAERTENSEASMNQNVSENLQRDAEFGGNMGNQYEGSSASQYLPGLQLDGSESGNEDNDHDFDNEDKFGGKDKFGKKDEMDGDEGGKLKGKDDTGKEDGMDGDEGGKLKGKKGDSDEEDAGKKKPTAKPDVDEFDNEKDLARLKKKLQYLDSDLSGSMGPKKFKK